MDKTNFLLYKDFKPNVDILSDEQAGKLFKAVFAYVNGEELPDFSDDGMLLMAFTMLKTTLKRDLKKYKEIVERNRKNGSKGGRPPKEEQETQSVNVKPKKPSGLNGNQKNPSEPKKADSDSVIDSGSVIDSDKKDKKKDRLPTETIPINELRKMKHFENETVNELFIQYLEARTTIKRVKNSQNAINILINKVNEYDENGQKEMLENAITGNYQTLHPPRNKGFNNKQQKPKLSIDDF